MKKFILVSFALASMAASPLVTVVPAQAQAAIKSCSVEVAGLAGQGLAGPSLDTAVRGLATSIVTDAQSGALPAASASDCLKSLASLAISEELKASLDGIVVALNSGEDLPALAASQA